ncbi:SHUGOSHIN 2 [Linum perenne]
MEGEPPAKRSPIGRRTLSDITNNQSQAPPKLGVLKKNSSLIADPPGDLVNRLLQEKATLVQIVEERKNSKLLEMSATQLQNLRIRYQTLLLQNRSLAQSNSQILAELNSGKDRLKHLQHDLMCKDALLKSRNVEPKGKADIDPQKLVADEREGATAGCLQKANDDKKPCNRGRKKGKRSQSMGSTTVQAEIEKEKSETKRRSLRRQSAGFIEREPEDNLFEIDEAKFVGSKSSKVDEDTPRLRNEALGKAASNKSSTVGRPGRRTADKVQHHSDREQPETKRRCLRRQSASGFVESHEREPEENLFEIDVTRSAGPSMEQEDTCDAAASEARRTSMGRPLRRAAEKVCSYKEPSLIQKMRRPV